MWFFNDIRQRRGTKLQGDVKKACALLLCKIPNYWIMLASSNSIE
jgi:hypothetical protein